MNAAWRPGGPPDPDATQPYTPGATEGAPPPWVSASAGSTSPGPPPARGAGPSSGQQPPTGPYPPPVQPPPYGARSGQQPPYGQPPWGGAPGGLPPHSLGEVRTAAPEPGSPLPLVLGVVGVAVVVVLGAWYFLAGPGSPGAASTPSPSPQVAIATPTPGQTPSSTPGPTPAPSASPSPPATASPGATSPVSSPTLSPSATATGAPTSTPSAEPTSTPSAEPTSTPAGTPGTIDPAIEASIREVMSQVPPIRGLEQLREVPFRFITQERFEEEFAADFREQNPPERIAAEEALLKRLGLLPPDLDLEQAVLDLYAGQVLAFYDPGTGQFTIVTRAGFDYGPDDRVVVAHEFDHALQDQHYDLEGTQITDPSQGDRALAELALTEGDATSLMFDWATLHLTSDEFIEFLTEGLSQADQDVLADVPPILRRTLEFPYLDGFIFVMTLRADGDWARVDQAWVQRPTTTEQILHPEKYTAGEAAIPLDLPDVAEALGRGWETSYTQTMGELYIGVFVADGQEGEAVFPGLPIELPNADAAAGWGGDRLVSLDGPDDRWAVVWQTAWDTTADADEFLAIAQFAMADLPFPHRVTSESVAGTLQAPVLVLVANDEQLLQELQAAL